MLRCFLSLGLMCCVAVATANAQFDYGTFFRIDGQESIDENGNDQVISLEGGMTFTAELLLRDDGDALLRTIADAGGPGDRTGYVSSSVSLDVSGGSSSISNAITALENNRATAGTNDLRGFSQFGGPITDRGAFGLETVIGTFDFTLDATSNATITSSPGPGLAFLPNAIATGPGASNTVDGLIEFRSATILNTTAIPEPGSFAVLGLATAVGVLRRRRKS